MVIAFNDQSSTALTFEDASIKDIPLRGAATTKHGGQINGESRTNLPSTNPDFEEADLFQQLLSDSKTPSFSERNSVDSISGKRVFEQSVSSITLSLPHSAVNTTVISQTVPNIATLGSLATSTTAVNSSVISSASHTIGQITNAISNNLHSLSPLSNGATHSFSVLIPGQGNLNVSTQVLTNGVRSLQLDSDEKKFQSWLQNNSSELTQALNKELNAQVQLSVGATA